MPDLMNTSPSDDQGSETVYGFDYQEHCAAQLCLEMVINPEITDTICEYHEDIIHYKKTGYPTLYQVKKREGTDQWTFSTVKDALVKLFRYPRYKNVGDLVILGNGRPSDTYSTGTNCSLSGLIALCDRPRYERDIQWKEDLHPYEEYLHKFLGDEFTLDEICVGLRLLTIDLTIAHPEAIVATNTELLATIANTVWDVAISFDVAKAAYLGICHRVHDATKAPKQPLSKKRIARENVITILREVFYQQKYLSKTPEMTLDTMKKLQKADLENQLQHALERRMYARELKLTHGISSSEWVDRQTEIEIAWQDYRLTTSAHSQGPRLWRDLREVVRNVGDEWIRKSDYLGLGPDFAEGLFFDMLATCSVYLKA